MVAIKLKFNNNMTTSLTYTVKPTNSSHRPDRACHLNNKDFNSNQIWIKIHFAKTKWRRLPGNQAFCHKMQLTKMNK